MKKDELRVGMRVLVRHNGVSAGTVVGEPYKGRRKWSVQKDSTGRVVHVIPEKMKPLAVQNVMTQNDPDQRDPADTQEAWEHDRKALAEGNFDALSPNEELSHDANGSA